MMNEPKNSVLYWKISWCGMGEKIKYKFTAAPYTIRWIIL